MYLTAMFRPAIYFVEYFANYDYIKEELCKNKNKPYLKCNGTCYVESLLKSANLLDANDVKNSVIPETSLFFPIFTLNEITFSFKKVTFIKKREIPSFKKHFVINSYINRIYRPPEIV